VAHEIVTVSEVVLVAVIVYTLFTPTVALVWVTPPENETVACIGAAKIMTPDPPLPPSPCPLLETTP